ncbi:MAG: hypothetical protein K1X53_01240 [Candidatus Sumerlaeaceae bacterium]|nr:hypothetical protein [Candidatus Sumerlaeaceae bacterium]
MIDLTGAIRKRGVEYASRLRFPRLLALTLILFVLDLLVPDFIPFADEILLGLATALLSVWKSDKASTADNPKVPPPGR